MTETSEKDVGFLQRIVGDGRPLLIAFAMALLFGGGFAIFLAAAGEFLPTTSLTWARARAISAP